MFGFKENKEPWRGGVYLTTVDSTMTADILISKLAAEGIPCMKRHEGASNFLELYMGMSTVFPVELYVPEESLARAEEIIRPVPIEDDFDEISEEELAALAEAGDLEAAEEALRSGTDDGGAMESPAADSELPEGSAEPEDGGTEPASEEAPETADETAEVAETEPETNEEIPDGDEEPETDTESPDGDEEPDAPEEEPERKVHMMDDGDRKRFMVNGGVFIDDEDRECR